MYLITSKMPQMYISLNSMFSIALVVIFHLLVNYTLQALSLRGNILMKSNILMTRYPLHSCAMNHINKLVPCCQWSSWLCASPAIWWWLCSWCCQCSSCFHTLITWLLQSCHLVAQSRLPVVHLALSVLPSGGLVHVASGPVGSLPFL